MARVAIIDANTKIVENVIVAGADYKAPAGKVAIVTDTGGIGHRWNGTQFVKNAPSKETLLNHAALRNTDAQKIAITIPATNSTKEISDVIVTMQDQASIARTAERAKNDANFTAPWQLHGGASVVLNAKQWLEFNEAITEWHLAQSRAYVGVVKAINDGMITKWNEVDNPPKFLAQWPKRYVDTPERAKQLADANVVRRSWVKH